MRQYPYNQSESPFEKMDKDLKKTTGLNIYRLGLMLLVVAQLWLTSNFVKQEEFRKLHEDVYDIKTTLQLMKTQSDELKDHEDRLRKVQTDVERLKSNYDRNQWPR